MFFYTYISSASHLMNKEELEAIHQTAAQKNRGIGVTGFLFYSNGSFLQFLEGEEAQVQALVQRIRLDPRHTGFLEVDSGEQAGRLFPDWTMGFQNMEEFGDRPDFAEWSLATLELSELAKHAPECHRFIQSFSELA